MRLHQLAVQAFGPYADRQSVDFDALNDAGVFLLAGPTGAGKTSILDAVCFALYGVVPGERHVRGLRSDHASPELAPCVELELTLAGRRLRIERAPEWQRPKRRGDGTTTERARGKLFEITTDGERLVSDRLQEIGHELGPLLGMSAEQFQQVVLLPQGGFSTFLHAGSDERRMVLEKLFATQRFARIETWVQERAGRLRREAERRRDEVLRLLATMADRAGRDAPDEVDAHLVDSWRDDVLAGARTAVEATARAESQAREVEALAQARLRDVSEAHGLARRRTQALAALDALDETEPEETQALQRLHDHRRAASVVPLLSPLREAESRLATADRQARRAGDALPRPLDREGCEAAVAHLQGRLGELRALGEVVARLESARRRHRLLVAELRVADRRLEEAVGHGTSLPADRAALAQRLDASRDVALRREECERALTDARARREAAVQVPQAVAVCEELEARAREAHEHANRTRTTHLDLVERRLRGMAAELAGQLGEGSPCQVCGSTDHPAPAPSAPDAVTRQQQEDAAETAQCAHDAHEQLRQEVTAARQRLALLEVAGGGLDHDTAARAEAVAADELRRAERAETDAASLARELEALDLHIVEAASRLEQAQQVRDDLVAQLSGAEEVVEQTQPQVEAVLGADTTLESAVAAATAELTLVQAAGRALSELADAERHHAGCRRRAEDAAAAAGLADLAAAESVTLEPAVEAQLEALVDQRRTLRARAHGVLEEPGVALLDQSPVPYEDDDLTTARDAADSAAGALTDAVSEARAAAGRHAALTSLADQLTTALAGWRPARDKHEVAESMSRLVRGTGGDNHLQMRLSSYVLATRLDQVLDAANERLQRMRDSRYTFHRSSRAARARVRSGLDIEVLDDWTGEARPPSTLSGGETFKLSLALALGLADVITHESGGLDIETLFIDEGFGMLDADTLDEVMDCIDDLRSGGRAVGVVSHVTELRARIPAQVHVSPSRSGSTIDLATSLV